MLRMLIICLLGCMPAVGLAQQDATDEVISAEQHMMHAHALAKHLQDQGRLIEAKEAYTNLMNAYPNLATDKSLQADIQQLNVAFILSRINTNQTVIHEVLEGETVGKIARMYNTTIELINSSNQLKNHLIHVHQRLRIWAQPFTITVDKSENTLSVYCQGILIKTYQVATGADNITPIGEFTITTRLEHPTWFKKGVPIPPGVPENALGTRWLGFNKPQYGIHGTIRPELIGQQVSHGCVRMRNSDVEELYTYIPTSTKVTIHD